ncbi:phosphatase PAP2 family protein [Paraflavitalea sp. CAU 1676]|uniref:phosphatase PAP2 family protein n=1 Tax=Paraflavitalea sp. CAU 1676 TaxID=3032598 RepID=UPI0023DAAAE9|nr:phosphatase PAP2 family protein [Paraflavitalea sp. CAU 1676]MDF2193408.1 phosphatase PAP2 family protein [Paraflavitalea sp. CAU 1676]
MLKAAPAVFFAPRTLVVTTCISALYLLLSVTLVGFKTDQLVLIAIFNGLYYGSAITRKFITGFSIFIVYWIIFDYMKAFPNYAFRPVHIEQLYEAEKSLFGIHTASGVVTPNEYFQQHPSVAGDWLSGVFYLCWVPVPLLFAAFLFFRNRPVFLRFALAFFAVNMIGFVVYYIYPAAPPWYVQEHGFSLITSTPGNTAGLHRFDELVGAPIFQSLYAKGSNVFAAMPSLHSAYPVVVLYYGMKGRYRYASILFAVVMLGIWSAAVYTSHHYVLDVLAGITCAVLGIGCVEKGISGNGPFSRFFDSYLHKIL